MILFLEPNVNDLLCMIYIHKYMMIGWGGKDFRWGCKVRCNTWGGKVRCNSAAKNHPSARHCWKRTTSPVIRNYSQLAITY